MKDSTRKKISVSCRRSEAQAKRLETRRKNSYVESQEIVDLGAVGNLLAYGYSRVCSTTKYLKFSKCDDGHYVVLGKGGALGVILLKGQGEVFKRRVVSSDFERDTEMTSECHRQMADFMDSLESKESRSITKKEK